MTCGPHVSEKENIALTCEPHVKLHFFRIWHALTCGWHVSTRNSLQWRVPTCQWEKKRIIDVSGTRQATKKNIKCRPLTCQPHVKTQNKSDSVVEAFYCWRVVDTSVVSKIEKNPAKKLKFHWLTCQLHVNTERFFCIWHALTCRHTSLKAIGFSDVSSTRQH